MNYSKIFLGAILIVGISTISAAEKRLVDYINPFIGTGAVDEHSLSGENFPGATAPFGLVQLSPDTAKHPPRSGYDYNHKYIHGFSHTHLSGTGVGDLYDVKVMPYIGKPRDNGAEYKSAFSHDQEQAQAGYYQVKLLDHNINAELTATEHVGFHRYTFPQSKDSHILLDLKNSVNANRDFYPAKSVAQLKIIDQQTIEGYRIITGWGMGHRKVFFRAEFSKPFTNWIMMNNKDKFEGLTVINSNAAKVLLNFETEAEESILVKVGLSSTTQKNAQKNLAAEVSHWDFDRTRNETLDKWQNELASIEIEGTTEQKEIFYTGLYHAFIQPNNIADVNGDYCGTDMVMRNSPSKTHYSTFSLWDTYRAAHPLYTLIQPKRTTDFVNSMLRQYETYGYLPVWQLWGLENDCMIGNHAIPVVVDAIQKGIKGIDIDKAYAAVKGSATTDHYSEVKSHGSSPVSALEKYGYVPEDVKSQSVSMTVEMAYDDWCVAQLAKKLGKTEDYERFTKRSNFYKNIFDTETKFFRGKTKDGKWLPNFNPFAYGANGNSPYTEGNAWQYLFYVPQDMQGLINLMGGTDEFNAKLDTFFTSNKRLSWKNRNASGFIGQYAHGNEPSHHVTYLYNFSGQPWKTQKYTSHVLHELYNNSYSGYAGNEDCGQMSAWYIFSSMGFYPVNPANGVYVIGSPILEKATINLEDGKTFTVTTKNTSRKNIYIQSLKLNSKPYSKTYITHNDIVSGGTLEFVMGDTPNKQWGTKADDAPISR